MNSVCAHGILDEELEAAELNMYQKKAHADRARPELVANEQSFFAACAMGNNIVSVHGYVKCTSGTTRR